MPKELTDGTYTLAETGKKNQFLFFRNDHGILRNVGISHLELYSKYLVEKSKRGKIQQDVYREKISFEISKDGKLIWMTVKSSPNLRIVKGGEEETSSAKKKQKPSFFKGITRKLFGKG